MTQVPPFRQFSEHKGVVTTAAVVGVNGVFSQCFPENPFEQLRKEINKGHTSDMNKGQSRSLTTVSALTINALIVVSVTFLFVIPRPVREVLRIKGI